MSHKPQIKCYECGKTVRKVQEVRAVYRTLEIKWRGRKLKQLSSDPIGLPMNVIAICECGYRWRLRQFESVRELREKFNLTTGEQA